MVIYGLAVVWGCSPKVGCPGGACNASYYYVSGADRKSLKVALGRTSLNKKKYSSPRSIKNPWGMPLAIGKKVKREGRRGKGLFEEGVVRMYRLRSR